MAVRTVILLLLAGAVAAGPLQNQPSECRRSCLLSDMSKFRYASGKTYEYEMESESLVEVKTIQGQQAKLKWSATVDLHFESPCEVTLEIKNPRLQGEANAAFEQQLTSRPLRAVMADGTFEEVCAHKDDVTSAVNIKKGILSQLQNTLPSNSTMFDGIEIPETDVLGVCPTVYKVQHQSGKVLVEKMKDHRLCSKRYGSKTEHPLSAVPLKAPFPLMESKSICKQEIEQGIVKSVSCVDQNELSPMPGVQRTAKAQLKSKLILKSVSRTTTIKPLDKLRKTDLLYDYKDSPKNSSASAKMESKLRQLCATIEGKNVTKRTAELYSELIQSMDQVEERLISETLKNIKANKYCSNSAEKLAELYSDAIASTHNTGAIPMMVEEILKGSRKFQYTWRLHTLPRVCIHGVQAVMPIFQSETLPVPTILAAGSAVARYCATEGAKTKGGCVQQEAVQQIMQTISAKIQQSCPSTKEVKIKRDSTVALLKAVSNIKNATRELSSTILSCFQESKAALNVRVAAADTLRNIPCNKEITQKLLQDVKESRLNTELRIFAYKAAVMCANTSQLSLLIDEVTQSSNSQVRSYILSDLTNLQQSQAPYKVDVRQRLARFNISQEYLQNFTSTSRSYDFSKFTQSGSFGSELDYELIFDGNQMIPRQMRSNFTVALFKEIINIGEMGLRAENLPGLFRDVLSPQTTLGKTNVGKMIRSFLQSQGSANEKGQLEVFVKLFGQEIFYSVLSDVNQAEHNILMQLYRVVGEVYQEMAAHNQLQSFKGFQVKKDLVIPTIQGMPLHVTKELAAVASVNATPSLQGMASAFEYAPVLSSMANLFVGYKFGPSAGLKINTTVFSSSDTIFRVQLDLPTTLNVKVELPRQEAELFELENQGYMMVKLPGQKEQVKESSSRDPRKQGKKCSQSFAGMQSCYDQDVLDLAQANDYPLVKKSHLKWTLKKETPSMKGLEFKFSKESASKYRTKLIIPGTPNPTKFDVEIFYQVERNLQVIGIESKVGQRPQGIKIMHRRVPNELNEVEVFVGGQQSQKKVFTSKLVLKNEGDLQIKVKTEGGLERLLLADVDVALAIGRPSQSWKERLQSLKLGKFEVKLATARCQTESFIRKSPTSGGASQFLSQMQLICNQKQIIKTAITSTLQDQDQGLKLESEMKLEHGNQRCEGEVALILNPSLKQLTVKASNEGSKMLQLVASDQKDSAQGRKSSVALELPKMDISWKVASNFKGSLGEGEVDLSLMTRGREVLSIRGPISVTRTENEKKQKSQLGIRIGQQGKTYHVTSEMEFKKKQRCYIKTIVNEEQKLLFSYLHDFSGDGRPAMSPESQFSVVSKIELPEITKTAVSLKKTSSNIQSDAEVKLEVISPRHIQAHVAVDTSSAAEGHVSAKLLWDKTRDPQKKIDLSGTYRLQGNDHFSAQGEIGYKTEKFQYAVSSLLKLQKPWPNMEKDMKIEVMKGSEEVFTIKNMLYIETMNSGSLMVKSNAYLLTPYKNEYSCKKELDVVIGQSDCTAKLQSSLQASTTGETRLSMSVSSKGGQAKAVVVKGNFEAIGVHQHEPALSARWDGDLEGNAEGGVEKVNLAVSVEADQQKIEIEASQNAADMKTRLTVRKNGRSLVRGQVSKLQGNAVSAQIDLPSRSIEMNGRYDRHVKSLTIYPNKRQSEERIGARFSDQSGESGRNLEMAVDYPHNGRQKNLIGTYRSQNQQALGAMELDVFSESGKALKVKINGTRVSRNILQLEASIQSNSTEDGPTIMVDLSTASRDMYIIAAYKKDSQSAPSILMSTKYIKPAGHTGVLSALLQTPRSKVEMGGVVSRVNNYGCQGYKLNSTLQSGRSQEYELEITTCSPVFIKIITGLKEGSERYVAKLGMESLLHAEMSLMKNIQKPANKWWSQMTGSTKERQEVPVVAISAKLKRPTTLTLRAQYNKTMLAPTMSLAERELTSAAEGASSMLQQMSRQISADISEAFPELDQALESIAQSIVSLKEMPAFKEAARKAVQVRHYLKELSETAMEYMTEASGKLKSQFDKLIEVLVIVELSIISNLQRIVVCIRHWFENLFGPWDEVQQRTVAELKSIVQELERSAYGQKIKNSVKYLCEMYSSHCEYAHSYLEDYVQELKRDMHRYSNLLLQDKSIQYARSLVRRAMDMVEGNQVSKMIQSVILGVTKQNVGVYIEETQIQVNLPLRQPVGSVLTALRQIGFTSMNQTISRPY